MRILTVFLKILTVLLGMLITFGGGELSVGKIHLPIVVLVAIFWFLRLSLGPRIWFALGLGFFMDTIGMAPWGTYPISFLLLVFAAEILGFVFANIKSWSTVTLGIIILSFIFWGTFNPLAFVLSKV